MSPVTNNDLIPLPYAVYPFKKISMGTYEDPMGKWSGFIRMATGDSKVGPEEPEEGKWFSPLFRLFGQRRTLMTEEDHDHTKRLIKRMKKMILALTRI